MSAVNAIEKGLPTNVDAERFVLGSIMLDDSLYIQAAGELEPDDFSLDKHRRIFRRMGELQDRGEKIDRITIANELMKFNELEACDGITYLVSLDDGLPQIPNLDAYIRKRHCQQSSKWWNGRSACTVYCQRNQCHVLEWCSVDGRLREQSTGCGPEWN